MAEEVKIEGLNEQPSNDQAATEADDQTAALISLVEQRASTYATLARLYREEIDEALLEQMQETLYPAATGNEEVDKGYLLIATYLSNLWDNSIDDLAVEFSRVFIGHGVDAFSAAYPYESVYTSEKRLTMQEARDEVLAIYRKAGLGKADTWKEGEDHVALELEFEQALCDRASEALRQGDEDAAFDLFQQQKEFLDGHLLNWVPMMTADVRRFAKTDLYQGLAHLTDGFLQVDEEFLTDLLSDDDAADA